MLRASMAAVLLAALLVPAAGASAGAAENRPRLGLWIECEGRYRTLDDAGRITRAVGAAQALGATDLFVQVYRDGSAWFATRLVDDAPHARARARGLDPLSLVLRLAHARGMRVHAWVNLLRVDSGGDAALVRALGKGALLGDETGRPLTGPGPWGRTGDVAPDTPGAWLDPGSPAVEKRLAGVLGDLVAAYPALDGVHLDYVRYPMAVRAKGRRANSGGDLGWSAPSRERFLASVRASGGSPTRARWDAWRRERLTALVRRLRGVVQAGHPGRELSAAVLPAPREAVDRALQDWPAWAKEGLVDLLVPMDYARDPVVFDRLARRCVASRGAAQVLIGVGAWRFGGDAAAIALRVRLAREAGAQGAVLFSHDNLRRRPALFDRVGALLRAGAPGALTPAASGD